MICIASVKPGGSREVLLDIVLEAICLMWDHIIHVLYMYIVYINS